MRGNLGGGRGRGRGGGGRGQGGTGPSTPPPPWQLKTELCTYHKRGTCQRGDCCWFAHGENELARPMFLEVRPALVDRLATLTCRMQRSRQQRQQLSSVRACCKQPTSCDLQ